MKKFLVAISFLSVLLWALVPAWALGAASVNIPFSRPSSSNSGYIFLTNEDGSKWFAFSVQAFVNNTELGGASSSDTTVSQQDANSSMEALAGGLYLQLELEHTNNTIESLGMAYVNTDHGQIWHSGEKINKERSDVMFVYQYAFYDGSRVTQAYGYDPGKINSIPFPSEWKVNVGGESLKYRIYGEVGGIVSLKVVRHNITTNKYIAGPYGLGISLGGPTWSWKNDQIAILGDIEAHISTTQSEKSQAQQIVEAISGSADNLRSLADSLDVSKPSVNGAVPADTPVQISIADNPALTAIGSIWSNDVILTLSIVSLTMATIIILLRGTHG